MRRRNIFLWVVIGMWCVLCSPTSRAQTVTLPARLLVGYWHNWSGSPNALRLTQISQAYDVINIAFAVPTMPTGATMAFLPEPSIYPATQDFIHDVESLKRSGKRVLISVGGAADPITIRDATDAQNFISSMRTIITTYGFDGMDIDLEGQSLMLAAGDRDFRNPTSPLITYFIMAVKGLLSQLPVSFMLTAAPETACLQGGHTAYAGVWGSYIPVIHALRSRLTYVHTQHYNTGSMLGRNDVLYQPGTADFHVAMADMLLAGFTVDPRGANIFFPPLLPEQVLIGLPASPRAAGSGFTSPATAQTAMKYIILGRPFGGGYLLGDVRGYARFRGVMTWSVNWDAEDNSLFSTSYRRFLDTLHTGTGADSTSGVTDTYALRQNYPNPFNAATTLTYTIPEAAHVSIRVYDVIGREVAILLNGEQLPGVHNITWDATRAGSGAYVVRMKAGQFIQSRRMLLLR